MMHLEILLEEPSAEAALGNLLPKLLGSDWEWRFLVFNGKAALLRNLPARLRGYRRWIPPDWRVLVLIDEDRQDCLALKDRLEAMAEEAGLSTKSAAGQGPFQVLNRVVVEELEAWFFGDTEAIVAAYDGVPATLGQQRPYRDPDCIAGGTSEALARVLQKAGHYSAGLPKIEVARRISEHMDPTRNRSHSFQVFRAGLSAL